MNDTKKPPRRGDATGEWRTVTSVRPHIETGLFKGLDSLTIAQDGTPREGEDPYNQAKEPPARADAAKPKRRSLDDMRRLSEMIKNNRQKK